MNGRGPRVLSGRPAPPASRRRAGPAPPGHGFPRDAPPMLGGRGLPPRGGAASAGSGAASLLRGGRAGSGGLRRAGVGGRAPAGLAEETPPRIRVIRVGPPLRSPSSGACVADGRRGRLIAAHPANPALPSRKARRPHPGTALRVGGPGRARKNSRRPLVRRRVGSGGQIRRRSSRRQNAEALSLCSGLLVRPARADKGPPRDAVAGRHFRESVVIGGGGGATGGPGGGGRGLRGCSWCGAGRSSPRSIAWTPASRCSAPQARAEGRGPGAGRGGGDAGRGPSKERVPRDAPQPRAGPG